MQNTQYNIQEEYSRHLSDYYFILLKHKWVVIAACIIGVSLAMYQNSGLIPVYKTTATIVIEGDRRTSPITGQIMNYESFYSGALDFNTHFRLMTSHSVLERVVKKPRAGSDGKNGSITKNSSQNPSVQTKRKHSASDGKKRKPF